MRKDNKPTEEQLRELYQAASEFKKAQPWKWFYDSDIICVENPKDKTIGYCSIMGKAGEHYALGVYLGNDGIYGFYRLMECGDNIPKHQMLHFHNCIMCSFEDREMLTDAERKQIKALGLSFRGRGAWPMFRRFEPGYSPWFINEEECIFLTHALRQTLIVAADVMDGKLKMNMEHGETVLRYSENRDGKLEWFSKEMKLTVPTVSYTPVEINDDLLVQRIKRAGKMGNVTLQADICYITAPVQENKGERPYFPRVFILAEQVSGMILGFEMYEDISDDANVTLNKLIDICLKEGVPKEIRVRSEAMVAILDDFCKKVGIKLNIVEELPAVDEMMEEMAYRF